MNILFLDDSVERTKVFKSKVPNATCVETSTACIEYLEKETFDVVFLDHDLGGEEFCDSSRVDTGMEVVRWIVSNQPEIGQIVLHSLNPGARQGMFNVLCRGGYNCIELPFAWQVADIFV